MTGIMVVLAVTFRSTQGTNLLLNESRGAQKEFFDNPQKVRDWSTLVETLLIFGAWLRQDPYKVELVERAKVKVKEVMSMMKGVGQRQKGMGDNRSVFHGVIHIPEMILNLGAPKHFDTQHNESDHRPDKKDADRTQHRLETFEVQVATKTVHRQAVELGVFELETGRRTWHYFRRLDNHINPPNLEQNPPIPPVLEGTTVRFSMNYTTGQFTKKVYSRSVDKDKYNHDAQVTAHLLELAQDFHPYLGHLDVFGTLKIHSSANDGDNNTQIYRAEPFREGSPWCDWGIFLWSDALGENKLVLGQMKCFVDLRNIPVPNCRDLEPGIYTHMEIATPNPSDAEQRRSELFSPWLKKPSDVPEFAESHNLLELVNINKLAAPAVVVPDLANKNKRAYLRMLPRWQWALQFEDWLEQPHRRLWDKQFAAS